MRALPVAKLWDSAKTPEPRARGPARARLHPPVTCPTQVPEVQYEVQYEVRYSPRPHTVCKYSMAGTVQASSAPPARPEAPGPSWPCLRGALGRQKDASAHSQGGTSHACPPVLLMVLSCTVRSPRANTSGARPSTGRRVIWRRQKAPAGLEDFHVLVLAQSAVHGVRVLEDVPAGPGSP